MDDDDWGTSSADDVDFPDSSEDPESILLRREREREEGDPRAKAEAVFAKLDKVLADFTPAQRRFFVAVFSDGDPVPTAAKAAGIKGDAKAQFALMLAKVKSAMGK